MRVNYKILIIVAICLIGMYFLFSSYKWGAQDDGGIISVSVYQSYNDSRVSKIVIADEAKIKETIPLTLLSSKAPEVNQITITKALNSFKKQGYKLITSNAIVHDLAIKQNYVFEK